MKEKKSTPKYCLDCGREMEEKDRTWYCWECLRKWGDIDLLKDINKGRKRKKLSEQEKKVAWAELDTYIKSIADEIVGPDD
jgi:hypothetical protein